MHKDVPEKLVDVGKLRSEIEEHVNFEHRLQIGRRDLGLIVLRELRNARQRAVEVVSPVILDDDEGGLHILRERLAGAFQVVQIDSAPRKRIACVIHNERRVVLRPLEILVVKRDDHKPYCLHEPVNVPEFAPSIVIWMRLFPLSANR